MGEDARCFLSKECVNMMKYFIRLAMLMATLALFVLPAAHTASATTNWLPGDFVGDQSFTFGGAVGSGWEVNYLWNSRQMARVGQEFTPTLPALNVVDLAPFTCDGCSQ